jgi:branched-chain amino acid transport system ATP-binding protein
LADELSVGLAPVVLDEIFEVVDAFRRQGRSLVVVEQYVDRVLALADYVYIFNKGDVVFVGEPAQCRDDSVFERYLGAAV